MIKITLLISGLLILSSGMFAQETRKSEQKTKPIQYDLSTVNERCGTTQMMTIIRNQDPVAYDIKQVQKEQALQNWIANNYDAQSKKAVIYIPVVAIHKPCC